MNKITQTLSTTHSIYIPLIIERLKEINPDQIILFGSYARGDPNESSDLDLLIVTDSEVIPQSYKEKLNLYQVVAKRIEDIQKQIPLDLIVQTRSMFRKFIELRSRFSQEILNQGIVLYEAHHSRMVK